MQMRPVVLTMGEASYPPCPFDPPSLFPELEGLADRVCAENAVYSAVREALAGLDYDAERFGQAAWSPLSDLVPRGGCVVLKPNFVRHFNESPDGVLETVVTHPSILRPLIDYAWKAVGPEGRVIVADAPQYDCEVETLLERNRLPELMADCERRGIRVEWRDLRVQFGRHRHGIVELREDLPGDPEGYEAVDLGERSEFATLPEQELARLRGADYDEEVTLRHHREGRNEYLVSRTVLNADLVINCPKIKTHKKAGVTLAAKNLIGINGDKNWLPHYRSGFRGDGGDEFPEADGYSRLRHAGGEFARRLLKRGIGGPIFRRIRAAENAAGLGDRPRNGNWSGNDTIWRTCLDLVKILHLGDRNGEPGAPARRVLHLYDGIWAGEGDGPMGPRTRRLGLLVAGEDPGAADAAITWMLGFDVERIPAVRECLGERPGGLRVSGFEGDPADLEVRRIDAAGRRDVALRDSGLCFEFQPHPGWLGRIERGLSAEENPEEGRTRCAS